MNAITAPITLFRVGLLGAAVALAMLPHRVSAQEVDHSKMHMPAPKPPPAKNKPEVKKPAAKKPAAKKPVAKPAAKKPAVDPHAGHVMPKPAAKPAAEKKQAVDPHAGHVMPKPVTKPATKPAAARKNVADPHAGHAMPKSTPAEVPQSTPVDHAAMGHDIPTPQAPTEPMDHAAMEGMTMSPNEPITPIPELTEADRAAAAPPPGGHTVHDNSIQSFFLLDRLEGWNADEGTGVEWEAVSWIGTDLNRLWLRSEGERIHGTTESADIEVLYGRSVATWWDVVAGVRHDFGEGPSQTFAAIGVMGLAPYKYEVEATAYIGQSGQTAARLEAEYETLFTNRLILQWQIEADLYGKDDRSRGIGSGLSTLEAGLRLRYEFSRKFAPYIGVVREQAFGGTADYRRNRFDDVNDTRIVAGLRIWF